MGLDSIPKSKAETDHSAEHRLINTSDVVANLKATFGTDPAYEEILKISYRSTEHYIEGGGYRDAAELGLFVEARHQKMNALLLQKQAELGVEAVVEVGAGLSSRALEIGSAFPIYFDTDLRDNVETRKLVNELRPNERVHVQEFDVLNGVQASGLAAELGTGPVAVVAEGVFPYFSRPMIEKTFDNVDALLVNGGVVIFDIATQRGLQAERAGWTQASRDLLKNLYKNSGIDETNVAFADLKEAIAYFKDRGFDVEVTSLDEGMQETELTRYNQLSEAVRNSILESPCVFVCTRKAHVSHA